MDDPLDAVAVHMGGGLWGLVAVALFQLDDGIVFGGNGKVLAWNVAGALAIIGWVGGVCIIMFGSLRLFGWLRVPLEMEIQGEFVQYVCVCVFFVFAWCVCVFSVC